jgi:hypothetical protein
VIAIAVGANQRAAVGGGAQAPAKGAGADGEALLVPEERLAKNVPVLGLGGAAVRRGPLLEGPDDLLLDVADGQLRHGGAFKDAPSLQALCARSAASATASRESFAFTTPNRHVAQQPKDLMLEELGPFMAKELPELDVPDYAAAAE